MTSKRGLKDRPTDFSGVVAKNWSESMAYLLAGREPCIEIVHNEIGAIRSNRNLALLGPGQLDHIDRRRIWILGVLLCPGDDVKDLTEWVRRHRIDPGHMWFFLHPSTDMLVLQGWADAGYPTDQVDFVDDWGTLHRVFGLYLSDHIYEAKGPAHKRTWTPGRRPKV